MCVCEREKLFKRRRGRGREVQIALTIALRRATHRDTDHVIPRTKDAYNIFTIRPESLWRRPSNERR